MLSRFNHVQLFATPWTVVCQAPLSTGFSRQEYWSGWPCPPPGDLPDPGIKSESPALQADSLPIEPPGKPNPCIAPYKKIISKQTIDLNERDKIIKLLEENKRKS